MGYWLGVHGALLRICKAFSIDVSIRLGDDSIVHPLGGFEEEGNIESEAAVLNGNGIVNN